MAYISSWIAKITLDFFANKKNIFAFSVVFAVALLGIFFVQNLMAENETLKIEITKKGQELKELKKALQAEKIAFEKMRRMKEKQKKELEHEQEIIKRELENNKCYKTPLPDSVSELLRNASK